MRSAVDALPPPQRRALRVAFFDEPTREQAAEFLDAPVGTVKTRVRAARAKLRGRLVPYAVAVALAASPALLPDADTWARIDLRIDRAGDRGERFGAADLPRVERRARALSPTGLRLGSIMRPRLAT